MSRRVTTKCRCSSAVEQSLRKGKVGGPNPLIGSKVTYMKVKKICQNVKNKLVQLFGRMFFHDLPSIILIVLALLILLFLFLILFFRLRSTDYLVPLSYNSIYGVTASVVWYKLYFLPASYLIILILNILIAWAFFEKERLITYLILFISVLLGVLMIIMEYNLTVLIRG